MLHTVNIFTFLFTKLLKENYTAVKKFHFPKFIIDLFYLIYFRELKHLLDPYFEIAFDNLNNYKFKGVHNSSHIIWMFWWQGYNNMPKIVKYCISSIRRYSNGHHVILVTKYNVRKYTNIPEIIYKRISEGYITLTHFSDILRFNLLNNYGGLWCDSTLYCTSKLSDLYFSYLYTSSGYSNPNPKWTYGKWTGFLMGGYKHNALFQFMSNYFNLYWKYNKYQIDYFLIDLGLHYAYIHNIGDFKHYVNQVEYLNNPYLFRLSDLLNKSYNDNLFSEITSNTNMFKLTYKIQYNDNGKNFYHYLINNELYLKNVKLKIKKRLLDVMHE